MAIEDNEIAAAARDAFYKWLPNARAIDELASYLSKFETGQRTLLALFVDGFRNGARYGVSAVRPEPNTPAPALSIVIEQRDYYYGVLKQILELNKGSGFFDAVPFANAVIERCRRAIESAPSFVLRCDTCNRIEPNEQLDLRLRCGFGDNPCPGTLRKVFT